MRWGPGPVFAYEWLTTTRRRRLYALRAGFVAVILAGMMLVWQSSNRVTNPGEMVSIQVLASYGESLYKTVVSIELTLVLLVAPAAAAGAICQDKVRGTLDHMLATDLSNAEIVLGKLGARLVPVLGLIACVLPLTALTGLLGGIDPLALLGSFLTATGCAILSCSFALTLSVWGRKTHEVTMFTYILVVVWLIGVPLVGSFAWGRSECLNPYYLAFAPYEDPGKVGLATYVGFMVVCLIFSGLLMGLATYRIRGVASKQTSRSMGGPRRSRFARFISALPRWPALPGPSLDSNPVLWREWHRSRPSLLLRVVWMLYAGMGILCLVNSLPMFSNAPNPGGAIAFMSTWQVSLGLLLLSVNAAACLGDERAQGNLDALLCTSLSTRSILVGKWLGSFRHAHHVLVWPAILAGTLVIQSAHVISYLLLLTLIVANCAVITSLGLLLAILASRPGRAVALCVSAYVIYSIGWLVLVCLLGSSGPNDYFAMTMMMGSPLFGTLFATAAVAPVRDSFPGIIGTSGIGALIWIVIDGISAALLFTGALATFDHCLGRVSEKAGRRPPTRKGQAAADESSLEEWLTEDPERFT